MSFEGFIIEPEPEDPITPYAIEDLRDETWSDGKLIAGPYPHFKYHFRRDEMVGWARAYREQMNVVTIMAVSNAGESDDARRSRDEFLSDIRAYLSRRYKNVRQF